MSLGVGRVERCDAAWGAVKERGTGAGVATSRDASDLLRSALTTARAPPRPPAAAASPLPAGGSCERLRRFGGVGGSLRSHDDATRGGALHHVCKSET
ncbi:Protein of unknown function [Gryllus bimaculatus]|nr:Protein of unknown function [Gryllus bimaculatus]